MQREVYKSAPSPGKWQPQVPNAHYGYGPPTPL
uniref:Uncharacterized protein n=1 Tax=Nelumbo nucifera TaxID=4432 RepID=A0A822YGZ3_NELNU|nr:TPA_asm: hypothetical protein HUJ06_009390 [Nelumbo nucifera]